MPERGKFRKLFDSTELMCDGFLQSFLILVSSPLVSPPYPQVNLLKILQDRSKTNVFVPNWVKEEKRKNEASFFF